MNQEEPKELTLKDVEKAVSGTAAAFRCRTRLQPAGGEGDKVFPPTYAGAVYAVEQRRVKIERADGSQGFETVTCVLLDSVQSQANRMEEALQDAIDAGRIKIPVIQVDFSSFYPGDEKPEKLRLIDPIGMVTSLQVPHRVADAILRLSVVRNGDEFRKSEEGRLIDRARVSNATPLYKICPTALIFGIWDSTGPKGGLGSKFERAISSEVVGVGAVFGTRTQSRIDPVIAKNPELYQKADSSWTVDPDDAEKDAEGKPKKFGKKLSEMNLGNVPPDYARYDAKAITNENRQTVDPMRSDGSPIQAGRVRPGGVTIDYAEQTTVLSLAALRRLRFPEKDKSWEPGEQQRKRDSAARTVLAALALCAAELAVEAGLYFRSRCLLWPDDARHWELLEKPGQDAKPFKLDADSAISLLQGALKSAREAGLEWESEPIPLTPSEDLVKLVRQSQLAAAKGVEREEGA